MADFVGKKHTITFTAVAGQIRDRTRTAEIVFKTIPEEEQMYQQGDHVYFPDINKSVEILVVEKVHPSGRRYITDYVEYAEDSDSFETELKKIADSPKPGSIVPVVSVTGKKKWWSRR